MIKKEKVNLPAPFIRFRHGNKLSLKSNIRESINIFLKAYKRDSGQAFKEIIKDIADGSGWGIHPDSTWFRTIQELFELYKDWEKSEKEKALSAIVGILKILSRNTNIEDTWNVTIKKIENNIEVLSCWKFYYIKKISEEHKIIRGQDGTYYQIENGSRITVIGLKTIEENKFAYINDDIERDFGKIGSLIKLIEMLFISLDFQKNPQLYRHELSYLLSESNNNTWFLHGAWRVETAYELIPIGWHPRNCYTDVNWLKSEVISILAKKCRVSNWAVPKIPSTDDKISKWEEAFKNYPSQYEVAYETDIIFGGVNSDEVYFEFEGRKLRWINGTKYIYPSLIIPAKDNTYKGERDISQKFISSLVFSEKYPIRECCTGGCPKRFPPFIRQPRSHMFLGIPKKVLISLSKKRTTKEWEALSYYKEAVNSESVYFKFLCFYNTIKIAFLDPVKNVEENGKIDKWIDSQAQKLSIPQTLLTNLASKGKTLSEYLRHEGGRDAISHVGILTKGKHSHPTIIPDNIKDREKIRELIPIVQKLATIIIESGIIK